MWHVVRPLEAWVSTNRCRVIDCLLAALLQQVLTAPLRRSGHAGAADVATGLFQQAVAGALFTPIDIVKERLQVTVKATKLRAPPFGCSIVWLNLTQTSRQCCGESSLGHRSQCAAAHWLVSELQAAAMAAGILADSFSEARWPRLRCRRRMVTCA